MIDENDKINHSHVDHPVTNHQDESDDNSEEARIRFLASVRTPNSSTISNIVEASGMGRRIDEVNTVNTKEGEDGVVITLKKDSKESDVKDVVKRLQSEGISDPVAAWGQGRHSGAAIRVPHQQGRNTRAVTLAALASLHEITRDVADKAIRQQIDYSAQYPEQMGLVTFTKTPAAKIVRAKLNYPSDIAYIEVKSADNPDHHPTVTVGFHDQHHSHSIHELKEHLAIRFDANTCFDATHGYMTMQASPQAVVKSMKFNDTLPDYMMKAIAEGMERDLPKQAAPAPAVTKVDIELPLEDLANKPHVKAVLSKNNNRDHGTGR